MSAIAGIGALIVGYIAVHDRVSRATRSLIRSALIRFARGREYLSRRLLPGKPCLVVGCFHYEPLSRQNGHDRPPDTPQFEGPWPRLIQDIARIMDFEVKLEPISASAFTESAATPPDLVVGAFRTPHRNLTFEFSAPFHRIRLQGICRRDRPKVTKEELVSGTLRILVQAGEVGWEYVDDQLAHLRRIKGLITEPHTVATFEILHLLDTMNYDVAICDEISCLKFLQGKGVSRRYQLAFVWPMFSYAACVAVNKELWWDARRLEELNRAMKQARNAPDYLDYERQWIGPEFAAAIEKCYIGVV